MVNLIFLNKLKLLNWKIKFKINELRVKKIKKNLIKNFRIKVLNLFKPNSFNRIIMKN